MVSKETIQVWIKTVKSFTEWQLFHIQNGKKIGMDYTFCFSLSSGREEFLGIGKIHQGKALGSVAKYLPLLLTRNIQLNKLIKQLHNK